MNLFLRRVLAIREAEQEAAILATPPASIVKRCRVCDKQINTYDREQLTVCCGCGGRRVAARLEAEDAAEAARAARLAAILRCAGINHQPGANMTEPGNCPHCGKKLRADNKRGACSACLAAGKGTGAEVNGEPAPRQKKTKADALKRFRLVAKALDVDADALLTSFCEGWLERVKGSANFGSDA